MMKIVKAMKEMKEVKKAKETKEMRNAHLCFIIGHDHSDLYKSLQSNLPPPPPPPTSTRPASLAAE